MKLSPIKKSLILLIITIILSSCEKDNKGPVDYLTAGNWRITGLELSPGIDFNGINITNVYDFIFQECSRDDLIRFNADGTITEDEGPTKCNPSDPQTITDNTWVLSEDGSSISATFFGIETGSADILVLNETTFKISATALPDFVEGFGLENQLIIVTMTLE
ncbi:MAG: hypothetical protein HN336_06530 [Lentimicrobiaceae bacterium]|jgi:hypothetical protein|nr:hypothetical protein [Lentimicrobiaceae bacterium]MBT3455223.1 hypothetical protein [Lentimicrobiaceae bacterium]MBT3818617.1 hypothetical protein [Lentimicrobiaceae bacterium]MBT4061398.1 hypothetical protein [Lentimicrobiaceae bacterium]MBT4191307.1 hypothetical protein [Lentimicrobiaceae bacterium]